MGAWYSTVPPVVETASGSSGSSIANNGNNNSASNATAIPPPPPASIPTEASKEESKEEAVPVLINRMVSQAYDNIHRQISEMQDYQTQQSEKLADAIASQLKGNAKR